MYEKTQTWHFGRKKHVLYHKTKIYGVEILVLKVQ